MDFKLYVLFGGKCYYPSGGTEDFIGVERGFVRAQMEIESKFTPQDEYDDFWGEIAEFENCNLARLAQWVPGCNVLKSLDGGKHHFEQHDISEIQDHVRWQPFNGIGGGFIANGNFWLIDGVYHMPVKGAVPDE